MKYSEVKNIWGDISSLSNTDKSRVFADRASLILSHALTTGQFETSAQRRICPVWLQIRIGCSRSVLRQNTRVRRAILEFEKKIESTKGTRAEKSAVRNQAIPTSSNIVVLNQRAARRLLQNGKIYNVAVELTERKGDTKGDQRAAYMVPTLVFEHGIEEEASDWLRHRAIMDDVLPGTVKEEAKAIRRFIRFRIASNIPWSRVDDAVLRRYRSTLRGRKLKTKTINTEISVIFRHYIWAEFAGLTRRWTETGPRNAFAAVMSDHKFALTGKIARTKNPNGGTSKTWVSSLHTNDRNANKEGRVTPVEIEIREMHRAVMRKKQGERNALMLSWVEETGARSMDLENLTLDHIPNSQILDQVREGLRPWTIKLMMKGEKPGVLRPGADLLQRTIDYRDGERAAVARRFPNGNSASLFLSVKTGDGLLRGSIGKIGKEAANDAGVVGVSIHRLRAVFGQRSFRAFSAAYEEEFKGIGPGGTVTASLLTLVAETLNHLSAQTLRPYMGRDFEARLRNAEAFKGFELDRDIEAKHRTIEMLEDRISHLRGFAKIVKTEANGDRAGTIHLLRLMLDSLMDELVS